VDQEEKFKERYDRLIEVINYYRFGSHTEFGKAIHTSKSYVSEILKNERPPKTMGQKLEDYLGVSRKWFDDGIGNMFSDETSTERKMIQQPTEGYVPVYDITFSLGFTPTFLDNRIPEILGYVNFPELKGSTYVVQAKGDSMSPLIKDRDFVGIRPVKNKRNIDFGNPYGVITEDLAVFKKLRKIEEDENKILLTSVNPEHDSYPIEKSEILHLFAVIGILSVKSITY
jgi:phage repressor protein C with HTH and peptisase S24 domain